ncbi:hypothetical protein BKA66DRAFT_578315 [Pyrenochaeta sp. MPI-SDFR-AT-0127]|nr:hypothetical protein BKA66DRAFT_578315 [Pyrenochaeta sp. MPI-SDFR-AT-0127]
MPPANKYAAAHMDIKGPGDGRPTAFEVLEDEGLEGKLTDKVILVTGASAGLGVETIRTLARTGATVFGAARDLNKAAKALQGIEGKIELLDLDLASLDSVRAAADEFLKRSNGKLNILVNNAGTMALPTRTVTTDGFEAQFGTNHLGHFLLFQLLKSALLCSSSPSFHSRVVNLSSSAHRLSEILPDDYNFETSDYDSFVAYGQAKTANLYMSNKIERAYGSQGLHGLAVHPGVIFTELLRNVDPAVREYVTNDPAMSAIRKSVQQGAATTVLAAIGKEFEGVGGKYLEDAGEWGPAEVGAAQTAPGYASWAFNPALEDRLWEDSNRFVKFKDA